MLTNISIKLANPPLNFINWWAAWITAEGVFKSNWTPVNQRIYFLKVPPVGKLLIMSQTKEGTSILNREEQHDEHHVSALEIGFIWNCTSLTLETEPYVKKPLVITSLVPLVLGALAVMIVIGVKK